MDRQTLIDIRSTVQGFIRIFGLLEQHATPCGYPLSLSQVYALQELELTRMSITELAKRLHLERSSVSRLVDGMVKENLIHREVNAASRRETILNLTGKGERTIEQIREQSLAFYQRVLRNMTEEELTGITVGFQRFTQALLQVKEEDEPS